MEDDPDQNTVIVIDNGSFNIKAGFNGDEIPKISLRNVIGENKDDYDQNQRYDDDQEQKSRHIEIHCSVCAAVENSLEEIFDPVNEAHVL